MLGDSISEPAKTFAPRFMMVLFGYDKMIKQQYFECYVFKKVDRACAQFFFSRSHARASANALASNSLISQAWNCIRTQLSKFSTLRHLSLELPPMENNSQVSLSNANGESSDSMNSRVMIFSSFLVEWREKGSSEHIVVSVRKDLRTGLAVDEPFNDCFGMGRSPISIAQRAYPLARSRAKAIRF